MRCIICKLLKQRNTLLSDYAYIIRKTEKRSRNLVFRVSVPTLIYNVCLVFKGLKSSKAKGCGFQLQCLSSCQHLCNCENSLSHYFSCKYMEATILKDFHQTKILT